MVPLVEDMLCHGRTGLTKAVVTGPSKPVLFYRRQSLGEGLSLGEARDAAITLTRAGTWVGKPAYLAAHPLTIQEGQQTIAQAIAEHPTEARGPGQQSSLMLTLQLFRFTIWEIPPTGVPQRCQFGPPTITPWATERQGLRST